MPKEQRENACSVPLLLVAQCQPCPEPSPSWQANPFQHRICHVFSTSVDGDDSLSFEDFLDMLSAFSDAATSDIKSNYAFRIFDFNDDGVLDRKDLEELVNCLTGQGEEARLSSAEMEQLICNVLEESDIDKDGTINLSEFQHVISRSPDFVSTFAVGRARALCVCSSSGFGAGWLPSGNSSVQGARSIP
uniref:EF-hand domain-containing protein n=1 Tax=Meleagris gallopavo TaxID=9103 RepID=G1NDJ9_MELGA